jgi:hypothetical protein
VAGPSTAASQTASPNASQTAPQAREIFRVFLDDGQSLPSHGEPTTVGDRLVFMLFVGQRGDGAELQLMSLPLDRVDRTRTDRYAEAIRAAQYAETRGELDYAAMTAEVQRALDYLVSVEDPQRRITLAEEAKRRLFEWSRAHYQYRAKDIQELGALFDEVIGQLRVAAGQSDLALDLRAGLAAPTTEPLLAAPTLPESVAMALTAARRADVAEERIAILRAAAGVAVGVDPSLGDRVASELTAELNADAEYAALAVSTRTRAERASQAGDVSTLAALRAEVTGRDEALGARRTAIVRELLADLDVRLERARAYRLALDRYLAVRRELLRYERRSRSALSGLDGLAPVLDAIERLDSTGYARLEQAGERLTTLLAGLQKVAPPDDLADVHATLISAMHLAIEACARRRTAITTQNLSIAREASAAAAGARLLAAQARATLVTRLFPPKAG